MLLPPYQGQGHGCEFRHSRAPVYLNSAVNLALIFLLPLQPRCTRSHTRTFSPGQKSANSLVSYLPNDPSTHNFRLILLPSAVEDPSEAFEDLRDKADLYTLISSGEFDDLKAPLDKKVTEPLRKKFKLADVSTLCTLISSRGARS